MNTKGINNLKNNIATKAAEKIEAAKVKVKQDKIDKALAEAKEKGCFDLYKDVMSGKIVVITDENDNIIGLNCVGKSTGLQVSKQIQGHMSVGKNVAEQEADEIALRVFMKEYEGKPVQKYFELALQLKAAGVKPDDIIEQNGLCYLVMVKDRQVLNEECDVVIDINEDLKGEKVSDKVVKSLLADKIKLLKVEEPCDGDGACDDYDDSDEYSEGYDEGYDDGYDNGYDDGYDNGYDDGINE